MLLWACFQIFPGSHFLSLNPLHSSLLASVSHPSGYEQPLGPHRPGLKTQSPHPSWGTSAGVLALRAPAAHLQHGGLECWEDSRRQ